MYSRSVFLANYFMHMSEKKESISVVLIPGVRRFLPVGIVGLILFLGGTLGQSFFKEAYHTPVSILALAGLLAAAFFALSPFFVQFFSTSYLLEKNGSTLHAKLDSVFKTEKNKDVFISLASLKQVTIRVAPYTEFKNTSKRGEVYDIVLVEENGQRYQFSWKLAGAPFTNWSTEHSEQPSVFLKNFFVSGGVPADRIF